MESSAGAALCACIDSIEMTRAKTAGRRFMAASGEGLMIKPESRKARKPGSWEVRELRRPANGGKLGSLGRPDNQGEPSAYSVSWNSMRVLKFSIALMLSILAGSRTVSPEVVADDQDPASADRVAVWQATIGDVVGRGGSSATYTILINRTAV